jgi:hypothetical protein
MQALYLMREEYGTVAKKADVIDSAWFDARDAFMAAARTETLGKSKLA